MVRKIRMRLAIVRRTKKLNQVLLYLISARAISDIQYYPDRVAGGHDNFN
jgi:hypothetical protein